VSEHDQIACAEHELRGAATALALVCEALRRDPAVQHFGDAVEAQLDRLRAGLADLEAARTGKTVGSVAEQVELSSLTRRAVEFAWVGGPVPTRLDRGRFAQALGNMLANAAEHGAGDVRVVGRAHDGRVSVEVSNRVRRGSAGERGELAEGGAPAERPETRPRGRGLLIASRAAEELGGRLSFEIDGGSAVATLHLPGG
jgi:two-component system, OmpR family, sensor histidine kinase MtrB